MAILAGVLVQTPLLCQARPISTAEYRRMSGNCATCHPDGGVTVPTGLHGFFPGPNGAF